MAKLKKVFYTVLGGVLGGIIADIFILILPPVSVIRVPISWSELYSLFMLGFVFGACAGLGISLGDILTPGKKKLIKIPVQTLTAIFINPFIFFTLASGPKYWSNFQNIDYRPYIATALCIDVVFYLTMLLGISIGKETTENIHLPWKRAIVGAVKATVIFAFLAFLSCFSVELVMHYVPTATFIAFGIIFISSQFDKNQNKGVI